MKNISSWSMLRC